MARELIPIDVWHDSFLAWLILSINEAMYEQTLDKPKRNLDFNKGKEFAYKEILATFKRLSIEP